MKHSFSCALVIIFKFTLIAHAQLDYFIYNGPDLNLTQNVSFTQFYFLKDASIYSVQENSIDNRYFPKCCPPEYKYHTLDRKCVKKKETTIVDKLASGINLIKSGLRNCEVIVDHIVQFNEMQQFIENDGILKYGNETFPLGKYCIDDVLNEESQVVLRLCYKGDYCTRENGLRCLKKCCVDGEIYMSRRRCTPQPEYGFLIEPYKEIISNATKNQNFAIFSQRRTCRLHIPNITNENVVVTTNGSFNIKVKNKWKTFPVKEQMYCFEMILDELKSVQHHVFMCVNTSDRDSAKYFFSKVMMTLSCCCFIVTMALYVFSYKLKKIIHLIVFCYCLAQFIGFSTLTYLQIEPGQTDLCKGLALTVLFGFLAGFTWLNVMCYDMWRTLGSMEMKVGDNNRTSSKKTLYYSIYGWSIPTIITVICYLEHIYFLFPEYLHAHMGEYFCLLEPRIKSGNYGHTFFFTLPIGLMTITNIIFFALTLRYIIQATDNIRQMSDTTKKQKRKVLFALKKKTFMALKLFLVMGINWSFEIISSLIDFSTYTVTEYIELLLDTFNCCQGIFIFLIFMLKWKIIKSLMVNLKAIVISSVSRSTSVTSSSI